jgi:photosynthetic reaction center cytochrome c subunit
MEKGILMRQQAQHWIRHTSFGLTVVGLLVSAGLLFALKGGAQTAAQQPPELQPAEKVFKNIQALNGMPAADLQGAMSFIASSLNVDCDYCHRQAFEGDTVPAKLRAREMILMVRKINQENFHGQNVVNCFTCHKGNAKPVSGATTVQSSAPRPATPAESVQAESLPGVQEILDHYVQALGGQAALDRVKTRAFKTLGLKEQNPPTITEWYQESPNKVLQFRSSQGYTSWVAFNGQHAWAQDNEKSYWGMLNTPERNQIMRDSEMYPGSRLKSQYQNVATIGKEQVHGHDTYIVAGISPEGAHEKFLFDAQTGLLLRRDIQDQSIFGFLPVQAEYDDYRDVDGVKIPFIVQWSSAGGAWGIRTSSRIVDIHQNVAINSEKFDHPMPGK